MHTRMLGAMQTHGAQATAIDGKRRQRPTAPLCEHVGDQPERLARVDRPAPVRVVPPEKPLHVSVVHRSTPLHMCRSHATARAGLRERRSSERRARTRPNARVEADGGRSRGVLCSSLMACSAVQCSHGVGRTEAVCLRPVQLAKQVGPRAAVRDELVEADGHRCTDSIRSIRMAVLPTDPNGMLRQCTRAPVRPLRYS